MRAYGVATAQENIYHVTLPNGVTQFKKLPGSPKEWVAFVPDKDKPHVWKAYLSAYERYARNKAGSKGEVFPVHRYN